MAQIPEPTLIELFRYNQWANKELMSICMKLDDEVIMAEIPGGYGSIRDTFAHILKAQASFLRRIHGRSPEPVFRWEDKPGLVEMAAYEVQLSLDLLDTLQRVPVTQNVHEQGEGWTFDYQARLIFMSVVYHGIAHRVDITTALNSRGIALPELDVWGYQSAYPDRFDARVTRAGG